MIHDYAIEALQERIDALVKIKIDALCKGTATTHGQENLRGQIEGLKTAIGVCKMQQIKE